MVTTKTAEKQNSVKPGERRKHLLVTAYVLSLMTVERMVAMQSWRQKSYYKTFRNELIISRASNTLIEYPINDSNCEKQKRIRSDIRKGRVK